MLPWVALAGLAACDSGAVRSGPDAMGSEHAPPPSSEPRPTTMPVAPARAEESRFTVAGRELTGALYRAEPGSPVLLLLHGAHADRREWMPLTERLTRSPRRFTVFAFDRTARVPDVAFGPGERATRLKDVGSALDHALAAAESALAVVVGSSVGAALAAELAADRAEVVALGLISPGQAIDGVDLYEAFAPVRSLPTFVAAGRDDAVSREPLRVLPRMSPTAAVRIYATGRHSARYLGQERPELWQDLEHWLMSVDVSVPRQRPSPSHSPGKGRDRPAAAALERVATRVGEGG